VVSLPDLQQPFEIKIDTFAYAIGAVLTQQGHLVAYHSEKILDTFQKDPTYNKEMHSIVQFYPIEALHFGEGNGHAHKPLTPAVHTVGLRGPTPGLALIAPTNKTLHYWPFW